MNFLEVIKTLAEVITSFAAAFVIIANLLNYCNPVVKRFFKTTVPLFFIGYKNLDGKKTRFFKGLKLQHEQNAAITKAISQNFEMEEVLVLNKKALLDILSKSDVFEKIYRRKE